MVDIKVLGYNDLTEEEKESVSNNGSGKEYAGYIKIIHNDHTEFLESDAMEPEDAIFCRDLHWIIKALKRCYELGREECKGE